MSFEVGELGEAGVEEEDVVEVDVVLEAEDEEAGEEVDVEPETVLLDV